LRPSFAASPLSTRVPALGHADLDMTLGIDGSHD
jgi:hypothetical protein